MEHSVYYRESFVVIAVTVFDANKYCNEQTNKHARSKTVPLKSTITYYYYQPR